MLLVGIARGDQSLERTGGLVGRALLSAELVSVAMKNATRRLRPSDIAPTGDFGDTWFEVDGGVLVGRGSFPSGHGIGAFAAATVVAERYRTHRWVPWLAYGLASTVAFSRVTLQAHFPSDVFAGAFLGHVIGKDVMRHQP
jgi:membrane-associated phospholipid phosphatase